LDGQIIQVQNELKNKTKDCDNERQRREDLTIFSQNQIAIMRQLEQDKNNKIGNLNNHQFCQLKIKNLEEALEAVGD